MMLKQILCYFEWVLKNKFVFTLNILDCVNKEMLFTIEAEDSLVFLT